MASITCHECRVRHEICDHLSFREFDKLRAENERLMAALVAVQDKIHDLYNRERDANDVYYEIQGVLDAAQSEGDPT